MTFMILDGSFEISKAVISIAEITVSLSLSSLISHIFGNFYITFMILDGSFEISYVTISYAETAVTDSLSNLVSYFFGNF